MIRKAILAAAGLGLLGVVFFGRDVFSYVRTSAGWVKDTVRDSVPLEFEIDRARREVRALVPDIRKNMHVIATEETEIERLKKQIADTDGRLEKDRAALVRLKNDLGSDKQVFHYAGGREYSREQVKHDLSQRFERFKTDDSTVGSLRDILAAREQSLAAAHDKLEGMLAAKRQLEAEVEHLDARLKIVEAAQTTSEFNFDDSRLARVKDLMTDIRTRLDVAERLTNAEVNFRGEIVLPEDETTPDNIIDQVTDYLHLDEDASKPEVEVAQH